MSIQPPSDIVLDVAKAADPTRRQAAAQKLARLAGAEGASFDAVLDAARSGAGAGATDAADLVGLRQPVAITRTSATGKGNPYVGLEAAVWQSLLEDMLPKNEGFFGDQAGGDITRSMLAEQLGNQLAHTTTLGIADEALRQHPAKTAAAEGGATPVTMALAAARRG